MGVRKGGKQAFSPTANRDQELLTRLVNDHLH